jgi:hypothetical protein
MKKEIIWNSSLILFAIFLVFAFTINTTTNLSLSPWHSDSLFPPVGFENKIKLGLIIGAILIVFRYINLGILSIVNKDLRLLVLLFGYSIPILFVFIGLHFYMNSEMNDFNEQMFPVKVIEKEISELRTTGIFKSYPDKSDRFITELAIGRAVVRQDGWAYSSQYWDSETNSINTLELLRLDTEKVWQRDDTEFVVEGNRAYEDVINELGQISEGHFKPTAIKESWESKEQIKVTFKIGKEEHTIQPLVRRDWADMDGILRYVNSEILDTVDYQFYHGRGGDIFIIGLTSKEKEELGKMTGIEFQEIMEINIK